MHDALDTFINEQFEAEKLSPEEFDLLLARGWRHFGTNFFRYNIGFFGFDIRRVLPLRIRLANFSLSKSQRRVMRKNSELETFIRPTEITDEAIDLFERHKRRFTTGVPDSIYDFLSRDPAHSPCTSNEIAVYLKREFVAVSYFDVGGRSISGTYAMFEPTEKARSLGIFTMLKEIEFAIENKMEFYYQGYAYEGESFYDYKKRFRGTEIFDWKEGWEPFEETF